MASSSVTVTIEKPHDGLFVDSGVAFGREAIAGDPSIGRLE